ncbi:hypothetical protein [Tenacibaculum aiptasiae]|uniref:hypothetical protein n=1 Tax=Tenacibaculum aiptasiae TaxID=426481 RepID=UPI00232B53C0|nr:hypothetical protein [Tenacibaculum aiptasiae]
MSESTPVKIVCNFCKQAVSNENFLQIVEANNPSNFYDWKSTIVFYCALHYVKSYAKTRGIILESHSDFNEKTLPKSTGTRPELYFDKQIRKDYINLRQLSYHARYDGFFSSKIDKILQKGRLKDSKQYLTNIKNWITPKLERENVETSYTF